MKIYVAARYARREEVLRDVVPILEADGHEVTSRWLCKDTKPSRGEADICLEDIRRSDAVLVLTEAMWYRATTGGGRWFEAGYAHALEMRVIFVGPPEIVFCYLGNVEIRADLKQVRELLLQPSMCAECGVNRADPPSNMCTGCQAYQDHTGHY